MSGALPLSTTGEKMSNSQLLIDNNIKLGRRVEELERALEQIYLNTLHRDKEFVYGFINRTIEGVLPEHRIEWVKSSF